MNFLLGMDVGSTTVKLVALDAHTRETAFSAYDRHHANAATTAADMLGNFFAEHPGASCRMAVCGSAGQSAAQASASPYIQEVVAASIAAHRFHADARVLIELGGQDAKVVFISPEAGVDMRMNGSCAGGTGAFLDQIASLLGIPIEEFDALATEGRHVYPISGRCGVFARTDIQPLLSQGVPRADIALSSLHAVAKQTLGGLAQGKTIDAPVLFLGGPCTFISNLPRVFQERLGFADSDIIVPERAEVAVAVGAALSLEEVFPDSPLLDAAAAISRLRALAGGRPSGTDKPPGKHGGPENVHLGWPGLAESRSNQPRFFESDAERRQFVSRHAAPLFAPPTYPPGTELPVYVGLDAGSTTSKFAVLSQDGELIDRFYASNTGEPLEIMRRGLAALFEKHDANGVTLHVLGSGATGYGEKLFAAAFQTDVNTVETVAHAEAARHYCPETSFILDIGGQDMKAIILRDGIITGITLNEACSAGCGSFLETYAASLGVQLDDLAELAFQSRSPGQLGSRCTVFMNSSIVTEQKLGKSAPDILAGLCRSIVENVFTKVLRLGDLNSLGDHILVQGGTFKNDAVLRAFEQFVGREPIRPPFPGEMGAIGAALLARKQHLRAGTNSSFISAQMLKDLRATRRTGLECKLCSNGCSRILVEFGGERRLITGNRCERGADVESVLTDRTSSGKASAAARDPAPSTQGAQAVDLMHLMPELLTRDWRAGGSGVQKRARQEKIGLPRVLGMWAWMPFWSALLRELGLQVVLSPNSSDRIFEQGLVNIPSDTACLPAKLVHGHITELINMGVDRILLPEIIAWPRENTSIPGTAVCAMLQAYASVIQSTDDPGGRFGVTLDKPVLHGYNRTLLDRQLRTWIAATFDSPPETIRLAIRRAHLAMRAYRADLQRRGAELLDSLGPGEFAVILGGRPYHSDPYTNHHVFRVFAALGVPVLPLEALPGVDDVDLSKMRMECYNSLHARLLAAAVLAGPDPRLEMAQLTSFGCGHDAVLSDETSRILREAGNKELLVLKLDEGDVAGPLSIRIRSFVETIRARRDTQMAAGACVPVPATDKPGGPTDPFPLRFEKSHRLTHTILVPNLSESFSRMAAAIFSSQGFKLKVLPPADARAVELGKCYVHNDICFPAQINIGEALKFLHEHRPEAHRYALGLAKNCENCRAGQYAVLARKALDEAGFENVPMLTTGSDSKDMHPGFKMAVSTRIAMVWGMFIVDALERMLRALRPYEKRTGETERVYNQYLTSICEAIPGARPRALALFTEAVDAFNSVDVDRRVRRPRVGIVGEILIKYHPTATAGLQQYLESHGMEIVQPDMVDFFRRDDLIRREKIRRGFEPNPWLSSLVGTVSESVYRRAWQRVHPIARTFRFHEEHADCYGLVERAAHLFDRSFKVGEGWLMGAEMLDMADHGVDSFVILQPFGCIPNHISGRGVLKSIQREIPDCQIVALDFDPDTPFANVENRLQMLIWNAKRRACRSLDRRA